MVRRANDKYGIENVTVTGHSLGGTKALHANQGNRTVVFNPGSSPLLGEKQVAQPNVRVVRNSQDIVSSGFSTQAENRDPAPLQKWNTFMMNRIFPNLGTFVYGRQVHGLDQFF